MRKIMALLAFAGALTAFAPAAHAAPVVSGPACGFVTATPTRGPGGNSTFNGAIWGGPVVLRDNSSLTILHTGSLTCTVTVNTGGGCTATSGYSTGTVAAAGACTYTASEFSVIRICSRVTILGGGTLYYTDGVGWTSTQGTCPSAAQQWCDTDASLPCGVKSFVLDAVLCPVLTPFFPPDGDVGIFYDCPPYDSPSAVSAYAAVHWAVPGVGA